MIQKIENLLGMARRAGKVTSGDAQVEAMMKKKKGHLLLIAEDGGAANKKFSLWAKDLNLPVIITGNKTELGLAIGMSPRSVVLIMDEGFAKAMLEARS